MAVPDVEGMPYSEALALGVRLAAIERERDPSAPR